MQKSVLDVLTDIVEDLGEHDPYGKLLIGNLLEEAKSGPHRDATYSRGDLVALLRGALLEFHSYPNLLNARIESGQAVTQEMKNHLWQHSLSAQRIARDLERFVYVN